MRQLTVILIGILLGFPQAGASHATTVAQEVQSDEPADLQSLRALLRSPEAQIDLAVAKLTIDRIINPDINTAQLNQRLDKMAAQVQAMWQPGASTNDKFAALMAYLYKPGDWNQQQVFSYDLDDPFGDDIRNKLLAVYLDTRKGNCISMPILIVVLGQKLGLNVRLSTAPQHVLAKFMQDNGDWINVEATSGGYKLDSSYQRELHITPKAMANRIYLRPLNNHEAITVMMGTLMEFYGQTGQQDRRIAVAELALQVNPRDVMAMLQEGNAYFRMLQQRFITRYRSPAEVPPDERSESEALMRNNNLWIERAEALGWTEPTQAQEADYSKTIEQTKATK